MTLDWPAVSVSEADVEHVRAAFAEFNERRAIFTPADLDAYFERYYAPGAVIENVESFPIPARYEGIEGYRSWYEESYGPYEDVRWEVMGVDPVGDRVVARTRVSGRPRGEDVLLEVALGITYEMRDGRIGHVRVYLSHDRALAAAADGV